MPGSAPPPTLDTASCPAEWPPSAYVWYNGICAGTLLFEVSSITKWIKVWGNISKRRVRVCGVPCFGGSECSKLGPQPATLNFPTIRIHMPSTWIKMLKIWYASDKEIFWYSHLTSREKSPAVSSKMRLQALHHEGKNHLTLYRLGLSNPPSTTTPRTKMDKDGQRGSKGHLFLAS